MAQVIVRNLDDDVVMRLKKKAADNHRSLEQELRLILSHAASTERDDFRSRAAAIRASLAESQQSAQTDSVDLIRADRDR